MSELPTANDDDMCVVCLDDEKTHDMDHGAVWPQVRLRRMRYTYVSNVSVVSWPVQCVFSRLSLKYVLEKFGNPG